MSLYINGIGEVPANRAEYTSGAVQSNYLQYMIAIQGVFDKRTTSTPPQTPTADDYDTLVSNINNLTTLAKTGITDPNGVTYYLTSDMANNLNLVLQSLSAVGIDPQTAIGNTATKLSLLQSWQSLSAFGVEDILTQASTLTGSTRTLQSMIELEYVKQGNDILATTLGNLQNQLSTTQAILNTLTAIQNISNEVTVANPGDFKFPPDNDSQIPSSAIKQLFLGDAGDVQAQWATELAQAKAAAITNNTSLSTELANLHGAADIIKSYSNKDINAFQAVYKIVASAQFRQIYPTAAPTSTAAADLLTAQTQLLKELTDLETQNPTLTRNVPGSLASFLARVVSDISNAFNKIGNLNSLTAAQKNSAVINWILDNQNQKAGSTAADSAGSIQNNITQAISASESLNDQQKQLVQNYMFIFQQFYQSASDVLQKINEIIQKHAQNIAR